MKKGFWAVLVLVGCIVTGYLLASDVGVGGDVPWIEMRFGSGCRVRGALPDAVCTPGVINLAVTVENMRQTICKPNWTATIRPPVAFTNGLKVKQIAVYGYRDKSVLHYEEDHLISLCLGGHPSDPKNLWPQVRGGVFGAERKNRIEVRVCTSVCRGLILLAEAQQKMARDWTQFVSSSVMELDEEIVIDEDDAD